MEECGLESVRGAPPPRNFAVVSSPGNDGAKGSDVFLTAPKGETLRAGSWGIGSEGHIWVLGILGRGYSEHVVGLLGNMTLLRLTLISS